jgi:hypothetical protein
MTITHILPIVQETGLTPSNLEPQKLVLMVAVFFVSTLNNTQTANSINEI